MNGAKEEIRTLSPKLAIDEWKSTQFSRDQPIFAPCVATPAKGLVGKFFTVSSCSQ